MTTPFILPSGEDLPFSEWEPEADPLTPDVRNALIGTIRAVRAARVVNSFDRTAVCDYAQNVLRFVWEAEELRSMSYMDYAALLLASIERDGALSEEWIPRYPFRYHGEDGADEEYG